MCVQLYRGLVPPLIGSTVFRATQFTAYAYAYGHTKDSAWLTREIPLTGGLQYRVVLSGMFASTARAVLESPLEFIKVRKQTGQTWMAGASAGDALAHPVRELRNVYQGFGITWLRTMGLMTTFFTLVDSLERHYPEAISIPVIGPFMKGGMC
ncbi:hypothetical protein EON67_01880, partial [archaeon]